MSDVGDVNKCAGVGTVVSTVGGGVVFGGAAAVSSSTVAACVFAKMSWDAILAGAAVSSAAPPITPFVFCIVACTIAGAAVGATSYYLIGNTLSASTGVVKDNPISQGFVSKVSGPDAQLAKR